MLIKGKILSSNLIGKTKQNKKKTGLNAVICLGKSENGSRVSRVNRKICI